MENAVNASTAGSGGQIVVAGAGYAGLHVALRLTAKLRDHPKMELTLVDRHDYHQALTELPRVAAGTRAADGRASSSCTACRRSAADRRPGTRACTSSSA
jgi:NADH dehydrogenase FAD-containing subunit